MVHAPANNTEEIASIIVSTDSESFLEKLDRVSAYYLGKPYLRSANGEGPDAFFDQNPLFRFDAFDCLTFVNTALALSIAYTMEEYIHWYQQINYHDGKVNFLNRNHFMSIDWNPVNLNQHVIEDVTRTFCDENNTFVYQLASTTIDRGAWLKQCAATFIRYREESMKPDPMSLQALSVLQEPKAVSMAFLPIADILDVTHGKCFDWFVQQMPGISLLEIVRPNWEVREYLGTNLLVSHVGFVIKRDQVLLFRHASESQGKVVEICLDEYLLQYVGHDSIKGIAVFRCQNPCDSV